ncbi:MAG: nucleotidyltransferase family protein [Thermoleophilia bacterium]|nr:nucleotidyltransferase family protein [Thermoleophilia bacterium]MDH3724743.1 nucleotidyltransferase family protein [Thermoleophilia bacterium]
MIGIVILGAGASRRMGAPKLLLPLRGKPVLQHVIDAATQVQPEELVVVVGREAAAHRATISAPSGALIVENPEFAAGQAGSLRAGIAALKHVDVAIVLLGDQPEMRASAVQRIAEAAETSPAPIVRARYSDGFGHPIALRREIWPQVMELRGDQGARTLMSAENIAEVTIEGRSPADLDTRAAYEQALARPAPE